MLIPTVRKPYKSNTYDFERYSVPAISRQYGVDIIAYKEAETLSRMYGIWFAAYKSICKKAVNFVFPNAFIDGFLKL
mgnify:CR=1 FL=1